MHLRALVIDDEDLARKRLRSLLKKYEDDIEIVGEARNGEEALERIASHSPDVVFLDVQMPPFDGFEVVRRLRVKPFIIFTTAYDEYALKAFEENSVDYLLKPIEQKRLDKAIEKLRRFHGSSDFRVNENMERLLSRLASTSLKRLQVREGDKILLIDTSDIVYFEAKDKYTFLHTADREHIIDQTLAELEEKLDASIFIRIYRSNIVNVKFIREIVKWFGGKYKVRLRDKDQTELVVSRGYVNRINKL